jgi:Xaa-Pro aminopeptidase
VTYHRLEARAVTGRAYDDIRRAGRGVCEYHLGSGVGIGANEPPYIGETLPGAPVVDFQPGMVFAVEPLIWVDGVRGGGGVRLEEMVLITEGDAHVMSRTAFCDRLML